MPEKLSTHTIAWLVQARHYLAENFRDAADLKTTAGVAGFSHFHFHRLFKEAFGETPAQYVARLRFEEAKRLLGHTSLSVVEVCVEVGYQSANSFSLAFARRVGVPPTEFRKVYTVPGIWRFKSVPACFLRFQTITKAQDPIGITRLDSGILIDGGAQ